MIGLALTCFFFRALARQTLLEQTATTAKKHFLKGVNIAYEQIINSFAKGDKKLLKSLLGKDLFADFSAIIDERREKQLKYETTFIGVKSSKILEFKLSISLLLYLL